ncbi:MAG: peptidylprolyl isomerase [Ferrimonas sp.]
MSRLLLLGLGLLGLLGTTMLQAHSTQPNNLFPRVALHTSHGTILVELDRSRAPLSVDNFLHYAVTGQYDNTLFHRIIPNFVVQGGGYTADYKPVLEGAPVANEAGNGLLNTRGTLAMARTNAPHSATNQFFFNLQDNPNLDPLPQRWGYAVFGEIIEGLEVLNALGSVNTSFSRKLGAPDVPEQPLLLEKVVLLPQ